MKEKIKTIIYWAIVLGLIAQIVLVPFLAFGAWVFWFPAYDSWNRVLDHPLNLCELERFALAVGLFYLMKNAMFGVSKK